MVRGQRKDHFFSTNFSIGDAGHLFPTTWTDSIEIVFGQDQGQMHGSYTQGGVLQARPDYLAQADMFSDVLKSTSPVFDESTEDGSRFRIYKFGSLEVRTGQESDGKETIGAIFCVR